jgi:3-phosphoglycerate kinase
MCTDTRDRREAVHRKTLKAGKIVFNGRKSAFDCTVRNMSETGAKVVLLSTLGVPGMVDLDLEEGTTYACRVARKTLTELGLEFL